MYPFKGLKMNKNTKLKEKGLQNHKPKFNSFPAKPYICIFTAARLKRRQEVLCKTNQNEIQRTFTGQFKLFKTHLVFSRQECSQIFLTHSSRMNSTFPL